MLKTYVIKRIKDGGYLNRDRLYHSRNISIPEWRIWNEDMQSGDKYESPERALEIIARFSLEGEVVVEEIELDEEELLWQHSDVAAMQYIRKCTHLDLMEARELAHKLRKGIKKES